MARAARALLVLHCTRDWTRRLPYSIRLAVAISPANRTLNRSYLFLENMCDCAKMWALNLALNLGEAVSVSLSEPAQTGKRIIIQLTSDDTTIRDCTTRHSSDPIRPSKEFLRTSSVSNYTTITDDAISESPSLTILY